MLLWLLSWVWHQLLALQSYKSIFSLLLLRLILVSQMEKMRRIQIYGAVYHSVWVCARFENLAMFGVIPTFSGIGSWFDIGLGKSYDLSLCWNRQFFGGLWEIFYFWVMSSKMIDFFCSVFDLYQVG